MKNKAIVVRAEVLKGKEENFIAATKPLVRAIRANKGNIGYNLYRNPAYP